MQVYSDDKIKQELNINKKYNINDVVMHSPLGISIAIKIIKDNGKTYCNICEKKFTEIFRTDFNNEDLFNHIRDHFDEGFRATLEEINTYFS